jgi:flagellin
MRINTNVASLNARESANLVNRNLQKSLEKLSSGLRINKAADDASGLAIADKLRTQASSLKQSIDNANSAASFIQIGDKAMAEQSNVLDIVKTKLIQAKNGTTSSAGRAAILNDIQKLLTQLDNIASQTNYNGITLLQASAGGTGAAQKVTFQIGETASNTVEGASGVQSNTAGLGLTTLKSLAASSFTADKAGSMMEKIDNAITTLNTNRSNFGSVQNQLESAIRNMQTTYTNIKAAESTIRDVDYAQESANFNKQNIIAQAGTYAMSQANAIQQNVLKLLQ